MPQNYEPMSEEQVEALMEAANSEDESGLGEDVVYACTLNNNDHLHVRRVGAERGGDTARVLLFSHGRLGVNYIFVSAADARGLAEHLYAAAEEVDGDSVTFEVPDDATSLLPPEEE